MSEVKLEGDELAVMRLIEDRLKIGRRDYGLLQLDGDNRDMVEESVQEVLDLSVYMACALLKLKRAMGGGG